MHKKYALLGNCTVQDAQQKISEFSRRYTNYQLNKQKNIWAFCIVSEKTMGLIVQIIDKTFEPELVPEIREKRIKGWNKAVKYAFDWAKED